MFGSVGLLGAGRKYATWNPADKDSSITLYAGNLIASVTTALSTVRSTIGKSSGKWYWECAFNEAGGTNYLLPGIANSSAVLANYLGSDSNGLAYYAFNGNKYTNGSASSYGLTYAAGDTVGVALNMDAGQITFYKNGSSQGVAFTSLAGIYFAAVGGGSAAVDYTANFGASAFAYTPPAGFNAGLYV